MTELPLTESKSSTIFLVLIGFILLGIGTYVYYVPVKQAEQGLWVTHTYRVLDKLESLEAHRTVLREKGDARPEMHRRVYDDIDRLAELTRDNPAQQEIIPLLRTQFRENGRNLEAAEKNLTRLRAEEERLMKERTEAWKNAVQRSRLIMLCSVVLLYVLVIATYLLMRKDARHRRLMLYAEQRANMLQREISTRLSQVIDIQHEVARQRLNLDALMQVITDRSRALLKGDGAVVEMLEDDELVYRSGAGNLAHHTGERIKVKGSLSGMAMAQDAVLQCDDTENDARVNREVCRRIGIRSMVVVPLTNKGKITGVLKIASEKPSAFSADDVTILEMMGNLLSATMSDAISAEALLNLNEMLLASNGKLEMHTLQLRDANQALEEMATSDGLTGLRNNRFFRERLNEEYSRARRYDLPLSVMLLDADHFKQYNDTYGHLSGDVVLKEIASLMKGMARLTDCVARYGGEEFVIILPQTDADGAKVIAERIRQSIERHQWPQRQITVSIGLSSLSNDTQSPEDLVGQADQALYFSKSAGRNCVTHSEEACAVSFS